MAAAAPFISLAGTAFSIFGQKKSADAQAGVDQAQLLYETAASELETQYGLRSAKTEADYIRQSTRAETGYIRESAKMQGQYGIETAKSEGLYNINAAKQSGDYAVKIANQQGDLDVAAATAEATYGRQAADLQASFGEDAAAKEGKSLRNRAGWDRAGSQRTQEEMRREARFLSGTQRAKIAADGGGMYGSSARLVTQTAADTAYNTGLEQAFSEEQARGLEDQAKTGEWAARTSGIIMRDTADKRGSLLTQGAAQRRGVNVTAAENAKALGMTDATNRSAIGNTNARNAAKIGNTDATNRSRAMTADANNRANLRIADSKNRAATNRMTSAARIKVAGAVADANKTTSNLGMASTLISGLSSFAQNYPF